MNKLSRKHLFHIGFRLSLLQSTWFEGGMQSIGFTYSIIPGLRVLYPDSNELKVAVDRYKNTFNTHPFMAGIIAGIVLRMEEDKTPNDQIVFFKDSSMGVMAAMADPFFKCALPTFVSVTACLAAILGGPYAGIIAIVVAFNAVHLAVKFGGLVYGYKEGINALQRVAGWISPARTAILKKGAAIGAGFLVTIATIHFSESVENKLLIGSATASLWLAAAFILTHWRYSAVVAIPLSIIVAIMLEAFL